MTVQTLAIIVLLVSFFVMIFLRFPIAYAVVCPACCVCWCRDRH